MPQIPVLDSFLAYRDHGDGPPIVFLHGNPTSSHLWRNVIPHVPAGHRSLAPDLVGMGASGKPDIAYRFADHASYLDAWFDALGLESAILVGHDWGGALALDRAARMPERVRAVAVIETFLRPLHWAEYPARARELFTAVRTPDVGERMVLERNEFLEQSLAAGVKRGLSPEDLAVYRAPFTTPALRRPVLQWPREVPIDGTPADVTALVEAYDTWLATSPTPKLVLACEGTMLSSPAMLAWAQANIRNATIEGVGEAGHHAPEDVPDRIGSAIARWIDQLG